MLWIGVCEAVSVAAVGGVVGGCLMALSNRAANKWNIEKLEEYWRYDLRPIRQDILHTQEQIDKINHELSTISVVNPVGNTEKRSENNGCNKRRPFKQG